MISIISRDKIFEYTKQYTSVPKGRFPYTPEKYGKSTNGILRYTNRMFSIRLVYFRILHKRYGKSTNGILRYTNRMFNIRLVYFRILQKKCWKSTNGILLVYSTYGVVLRCPKTTGGNYTLKTWSKSPAAKFCPTYISRTRETWN